MAYTFAEYLDVIHYVIVTTTAQTHFLALHNRAAPKRIEQQTHKRTCSNIGSFTHIPSLEVHETVAQ